MKYYNTENNSTFSQYISIVLDKLVFNVLIVYILGFVGHKLLATPKQFFAVSLKQPFVIHIEMVCLSLGKILWIKFAHFWSGLDK